MNGAQFVWLALLAFFAWLVVQRELQERRRVSEELMIVEARSKNRLLPPTHPQVLAAINRDMTEPERRRATIAQASYWP